MTTKQNAILIQMGSDERIPADAVGYVADLGSPQISESVKRDRLLQLSRYVPDLVREFEAQ